MSPPANTFEFRVAMSCNSCVKAVEKALHRLPGVEQVDISLEKQLVSVKAQNSEDEILQCIRRTGKEVSAI